MPLVDLLLQLFIAVVIFFPVVEYGMNINLPKGTTERSKHEQTRTVAVDKQGHIYLNDTKKTLQQLRADLQTLARQNPPVTILVKADQANNYGVVMQVLTELYAAKINRIALVTQGDTPAKTGTAHR